MKLYVSDIDGTLVNDIEGLSLEDKLRLARLLKTGFPLTFATGRVIPSGLRALGNPEFKLPLIGHGGAVMQTPEGEVLHQWGLENHEAQEILETVMRFGMGLTAVLSPAEDHGRRWWKPENFHGMDKFIRSRQWDPSFKALDEQSGLKGCDVVSMSCCGSDEKIEKMRVWTARKPDLDLEIVHDPYMLGVKVGFVHRKGSGKGRALGILMQRLNLKTEDVCVLGDGFNDVSLFKMAGRRVAPAGACEEILALADERLSTQVTVLDFLEMELKNLSGIKR